MCLFFFITHNCHEGDMDLVLCCVSSRFPQKILGQSQTDGSINVEPSSFCDNRIIDEIAKLRI